uniref:Uncharacterized protein n=2 Tax=Phaeomonas parva TaxID=124430 RepID=A0A7S1TTS1_9STRA|mmetsp:Transcript_17481/g.53509  ORF Transcript_17481/g.53509 Transcript_17481/m.53509 type:complete len:684 (+) Transcript_17481:1364-3415(+)
MSLTEASMDTIWHDLEGIVSEVTGIPTPSASGYPLSAAPSLSAPSALEGDGSDSGPQRPRRMSSISMGGNGLQGGVYGGYTRYEEEMSQHSVLGVCGDAPYLIVLDNCERVLDADRAPSDTGSQNSPSTFDAERVGRFQEFLNTLLHGAGSVRVLLTSSRTVGRNIAATEYVLALTQMDHKQAARLFVERSHALQMLLSHTYSRAQEQERAMDLIAAHPFIQRLRGNPYALSLAATVLQRLEETGTFGGRTLITTLERVTSSASSSPQVPSPPLGSGFSAAAVANPIDTMTLNGYGNPTLGAEPIIADEAADMTLLDFGHLTPMSSPQFGIHKKQLPGARAPAPSSLTPPPLSVAPQPPTPAEILERIHGVRNLADLLNHILEVLLAGLESSKDADPEVRELFEEMRHTIETGREWTPPSLVRFRNRVVGVCVQQRSSEEPLDTEVFREQVTQSYNAYHPEEATLHRSSGGRNSYRGRRRERRRPRTYNREGVADDLFSKYDSMQSKKAASEPQLEAIDQKAPAPKLSRRERRASRRDKPRLPGTASNPAVHLSRDTGADEAKGQTPSSSISGIGAITAGSTPMPPSQTGNSLATMSSPSTAAHHDLEHRSSVDTLAATPLPRVVSLNLSLDLPWQTAAAALGIGLGVGIGLGLGLGIGNAFGLKLGASLGNSARGGHLYHSP